MTPKTIICIIGLLENTRNMLISDSS